MATVNIFLDKRKCDIGFGIIKIRVTENRVQRDYSTKLKIEEALYQKLISAGEILDKRVKDPFLNELHTQLYGIKNDIDVFIDGFVIRARNIIKSLGANFSFEKFKQSFDNYDKIETKKSDKTNIILALKNKSYELKLNGQISHAGSFKSAADSINRFILYQHSINSATKKIYKFDDLQFEQLDVAFLNKWAKFMRERGKVSQKLLNGIPSGYSPSSDTTIAILSRTIRTIYNEAIEKGLIPKDSYPFGAKKFTIPESANKKKALTDEQLELLKSYKPEPHSMEERSLDLWLFSYYGNGGNFADMLRLKWKNLIQDEIHFIRQKTKRKPVVITIRVNEAMRAILDRHSNTNKNKESYIFPYLIGVDSIEKQKNTIHQIVKSTNLYLNKIAKKLGIEVKINTYEARHSFSSKLMRSGAPLKMIQEKLGHRRLATTEQYLGSFSKEVEDKYLDKL
jgi:integrase